jgi:RHS repeat-associated protein
VAQYDSIARLTAQYVYGSRVNVPEYIVTDSATYRLLLDDRGSVRLVVDAATGAIAQRLEYDALGRTILNSNPGFQPFGYAGGISDLATGLIHFGAREYDPSVGSWITPDPLLFDGDGANLYAYVGGDPVNRTDPSGLTTYVSCRQVGGEGNHGVVGHCAVRVLDANRGIDQTIELIPNGKDEKEIYWRGPWDPKTADFDPNHWITVRPPCGLTDEEFDDAVLRSAFRETLKERGKEYGPGGGGNSNRFVFNVIAGAGGQVPGAAAAGFPFGAPGLCGGTGVFTGGSCSKP